MNHQPILTIAAAGAALLLCSCQTTVHQSPVNQAPPRKETPAPPKKPAPKADDGGGALHQVPNPPPEEKKPYPDIPLKDDTGTSPLIHDKPDTPTYSR